MQVDLQVHKFNDSRSSNPRSSASSGSSFRVGAERHGTTRDGSGGAGPVPVPVPVPVLVLAPVPVPVPVVPENLLQEMFLRWFSSPVGPVQVTVPVP